MGNKSNKKKSKIGFIKKVRLGFEGFVTLVAALFSTTIPELTTGNGQSTQEYKMEIAENKKIEDEVNDICEKNQNLLDLAKKIAAYEYNKNKNEDEKISIENIRNSVELIIYHGHSHIDPFSLIWKKDGQGTPYALIDSSKISDFGGNGEYMFFSINGESGKAAKKGRFGKQYPAYFTNETINTTEDEKSFMFNDEEIYSLLANLVTAHNNQNTGKEVEDYLEEAKKLLKEYIEREGVDVDEIAEYLKIDLDNIKNHENKEFKESMKTGNTYDTNYEQLGEQVLGPDSEYELVFPEDINKDAHASDER